MHQCFGRACGTGMSRLYDFFLNATTQLLNRIIQLLDRITQQTFLLQMKRTPATTYMPVSQNF